MQEPRLRRGLQSADRIHTTWCPPRPYLRNTPPQSCLERGRMCEGYQVYDDGVRSITDAGQGWRKAGRFVTKNYELGLEC